MKPELDRGNIANAITDDFMKDVDITQDQFNIGQMLLSAGIVLFEIPSNMVRQNVPFKFSTFGRRRAVQTQPGDLSKSRSVT